MSCGRGPFLSTHTKVLAKNGGAACIDSTAGMVGTLPISDCRAERPAVADNANDSKQRSGYTSTLRGVGRGLIGETSVSGSSFAGNSTESSSVGPSGHCAADPGRSDISGLILATAAVTHALAKLGRAIGLSEDSIIARVEPALALFSAPLEKSSVHPHGVDGAKTWGLTSARNLARKQRALRKQKRLENIHDSGAEDSASIEVSSSSVEVLEVVQQLRGARHELRSSGLSRNAVDRHEKVREFQARIAFLKKNSLVDALSTAGGSTASSGSDGESRSLLLGKEENEVQEFGSEVLETVVTIGVPSAVVVEETTCAIPVGTPTHRPGFYRLLKSSSGWEVWQHLENQDDRYFRNIHLNEVTAGPITPEMIRRSKDAISTIAVCAKPQ